jgi:hypothetical protein
MIENAAASCLLLFQGKRTLVQQPRRLLRFSRGGCGLYERSHVRSNVLCIQQGRVLHGACEYQEQRKTDALRRDWKRGCVL